MQGGQSVKRYHEYYEYHEITDLILRITNQNEIKQNDCLVSIKQCDYTRIVLFYPKSRTIQLQIIKVSSLSSKI